MLALFLRDLKLAFGTKSPFLTGLLFFAAIILLTPFAVGPERAILAKIGPGILWIAALLSSLISQDRLFQSDFDDGSLDQFILSHSHHSLTLIVLIKCLSHWCGTMIPLILISPLLGMTLYIDNQTLLLLFLTLLCGTPALTFIGAIGASLTVSLPRGGMISSIIVIPLTVPVLIFGVASTSTIQDTLHSPSIPHIFSLSTPLLFLIALSLFFSIIGPYAAANALKYLSD